MKKTQQAFCILQEYHFIASSTVLWSIVPGLNPTASHLMPTTHVETCPCSGIGSHNLGINPNDSCMQCSAMLVR
ncbi:hypothetical protein BJX70DRAFT_384270 [Aspergillus crustosus]